jgi:predicted Zn-dependent protease
MRLMNQTIRSLFVGAALALLAASVAQPEITEKEIEAGKAAHEELAKEVKLITEGPLSQRVDEIGKDIAACSAEPDFAFHFYVIDDKDVNAFALPGGYIYVYRGLLDYVESDDELAAILAHELTHVCEHHQAKRSKKYSKAQLPVQLLTAIAILAAGDDWETTSNIAGVSQMFEWVNFAKIMEYTQDLEYAADEGAINDLMKSRYHPVALLTVMSRLARDARRSAVKDLDWGVFTTHPPTRERVARIQARLKELGVPIGPAAQRSVTNALVAAAEQVSEDSDDYRVLLADVPIIQPAPRGQETSKSRAEAIASAINGALDDGMMTYSVKTTAQGPAYKDATIFEVTEEDAQAAGLTRPELIEATARAIKTGLMRESLKDY